MKYLIVITLLMLGNFGFAKTNLSELDCLKLPKEAIAQDILNLMRSGADMGPASITCQGLYATKWVKGPAESIDSDQTRILLSAKDLVYITGPVEELKDEYGPSNVFKVSYVIQKQDGKHIAGDFSFSRTFEKSYIENMGCGFIQNEASVAFVQNECQ